jgi:tetratricopeptide (TPR) repeat protein
MSLVESILAHHQELGLDEAQFNAISKLFWSQSQDMNDIATISEVAKSLTSDQFCRAVALLTPQFATNPHQPAALDSTIEGFVTEALERKTKDKQLVEVELATKVAERVMGWAKLFAAFLAAPAAVGLLLLGAVGFSKFEDVKNASKLVDDKINEAQSTVDASLKKVDDRLNEAQSKVDASFRRVDEVLQLARQNVEKTERQLASVESALTEQRKKVAALNDTVTNLAANQRFALVIGNGAYDEREGRLPTTVSDAKGLADVLQKLGFKVRLLQDVDPGRMRLELNTFRDEVPGAEIALLFYAGHSVVIDDRTFLLPVGATRNDIRSSAIELKSVIEAVSNSTRVGLILIDACRKSPAFSGGCSATSVPNNVVLSYSTRPGQFSTKDSVYAKALQRSMTIAGLELFPMLNEVGLEVMTETHGAQVPWVAAGGVSGRVYLRLDASARAPTVVLSEGALPEGTVHGEALSFFQQAYKQLDSKDYEGARVTLTQAIELDPTFAPAYSYRGFSWYLEGLTKNPEGALVAYRKAFPDLDKAIELDPNYAPSLRHRGNVTIATYRALKSLGRPTKGILDRAISNLKDAVTLDPTSKTDANALAQAYLLNGQYQDAIASFGRTVALDASDATPYDGLCLAYRMLGQLDEARKYAQLAADRDEALKSKPCLTRRL